MLTEKIREDMKAAMKAREELKLSVVRSMITACTNELVAKGRKPTDALTDDEALAVLKRLHKQRTDSAEQFEKGGRPELAEKERAERTIIESYLPAKASREQIEKAVREKMTELGVTDKSGMGKLMGATMKALGGSADGNDVKTIIEELLH
ncbi:MAG: GatB/YqeY domain-containing protein [Parcubacteria group bacterium]|nr:GatB/YqeY domain-containing protein [Parcubacteria group bacterium]